MSDSVRPHRQQPTRLLCPWDSPGKNTGVGCHFLLQCMHTCMLSRCSCVQLCATLWTAAHQAPLSLGFSRQEYRSGLPFPSPIHACMHAKSLQLCPTLCDLMDSSPPGSSVHGILQARILEWIASSFSCINLEGLSNIQNQYISTPEIHLIKWDSGTFIFS